MPIASETTTHMEREVRQIPQAARHFLDIAAPVLTEAGHQLRDRDPGLIVTVARGSSDHAATYLKYAIELTAGIPVASVGPSIASIYNRPLRLDRAACIGISQSGQSPDIVTMMQAAQSGGALTIAITNHPESPLGLGSQITLPIATGVEQSVAATKTFVTSVLAGLALLAEWQQDGALRAAVAEAPAAFDAALSHDWTALADRLALSGSAYVLGRGPGVAIAQEMALKFKETCGLHAEAYSAAEVLHGPAAIAHHGFPVLALAVEDAAQSHVIATAERLAAQQADVFITGVVAKGAALLPASSGLHPLVAPLVNIVSFYLMVEALSRRRGFDPDTPPHLRKVTQTR